MCLLCALLAENKVWRAFAWQSCSNCLCDAAIHHDTASNSTMSRTNMTWGNTGDRLLEADNPPEVLSSALLALSQMARLHRTNYSAIAEVSLLHSPLHCHSLYAHCICTGSWLYSAKCIYCSANITSYRNLPAHYQRRPA